MDYKMKSALEFMPMPGSGESPASIGNLMKQLGEAQMPIPEAEKKFQSFSVLKEAGI